MWGAALDGYSNFGKRGVCQEDLTHKCATLSALDAPEVRKRPCLKAFKFFKTTQQRLFATSGICLSIAPSHCEFRPLLKHCSSKTRGLIFDVPQFHSQNSDSHPKTND